MVATLTNVLPGGRPAHAGAPAGFNLRNVGFRIGEHELLRDISVGLEHAQVYGLIGHNGSGKTTLMKLLARQNTPSEGKIAFADRDLAAWPQRTFAREVAYMAQRLPDATGLTVSELAALGRYPWHGALGRFEQGDRERVQEALTLTHMDSLADRLVDTLSGGERQRAWLAMLLAQDSRCILLDEPIAALDVAHQVEVMQLVVQLCRQRQLTVVVVMHDINLAARFCDQLIALHSGRLVAQGPPDDVVQPQVLERVYGVQMGVIDHPEKAIPLCYVV
ncbi:ABC transporter ATP-binding protein [Rhodovibrio salinarum]|uniref:Iron-hydroxamate transporter ATP-binding subunit n=1 Tax=Rhodovibrio salinarum TaxID=1087 RepID=A0A934V139_9PROT|nr:ATP-binding cassette domain-containing protein [Rhodovibrio salinarum]MBK1699027.1 iron-hydroxamate transporter ATP-binding subunit [Rhodovibrio salinarum]